MLIKKSKKVKKPMTVAESGQLGGLAISKKLGKSGMKKLGAKGLETRWGKKK